MHPIQRTYKHMLRVDCSVHRQTEYDTQERKYKLNSDNINRLRTANTPPEKRSRDVSARESNRRPMQRADFFPGSLIADRVYLLGDPRQAENLTILVDP